MDLYFDNQKEKQILLTQVISEIRCGFITNNTDGQELFQLIPPITNKLLTETKELIFELVDKNFFRTIELLFLKYPNHDSVWQFSWGHAGILDKCLTTSENSFQTYIHFLNKYGTEIDTFFWGTNCKDLLCQFSKYGNKPDERLIMFSEIVISKVLPKFQKKSILSDFPLLFVINLLMHRPGIFVYFFDKILSIIPLESILLHPNLKININDLILTPQDKNPFSYGKISAFCLSHQLTQFYPLIDFEYSISNFPEDFIGIFS